MIAGRTWLPCIPLALLALAWAGTLASCDPCSGVEACTVEAQISAEGQLIVHETGEPVPGVELEFRRTGGVALEEESFATRTDEDGRYHLRITAQKEGTVRLSVIVRPPGGRVAYQVPQIELETSRVRGEGRELGRWVVDPYLAFVGEMRDPKTGKPPPWNWGIGRATFRRTGGIEIDPERVTSAMGPYGRFLLEPETREVGEVIGSLTLFHKHFPRAYVYRDIRMRTEYRDLPIGLSGVFLLGASLNYTGEIYRRSAPEDHSMASYEVEFRRTGGIHADPDTFRVQVQPWGGFSLETTPQGDGVLQGELVVFFPGGSRQDTIPDVQMQTFDGVEQRFLKRWGVGPSLDYAGEVFHRGAPDGFSMEGYEAEFRRTGGIEVSPVTVRNPVAAWGGVSLATMPAGDGSVEGELVVFAPSGVAVDTVRGVTMETFDSDEQRYLRRWEVGPSLNYAGEVYLRDAGEQVPLDGVEVEFRRTGGLEVRPDTFAVSTTPWGGFSLATVADRDGEVTGDVIVHLPSPRGPKVIPDVRMSTFRSSEQRFLQRWGVGGQINYGGIVYYEDSGEPVAGAEIRFVRTGGIAAEPDTLVQTTTSWGGFAIQLHVQEEGDLVGDLIIELPAPRQPVTIRGIHIPTFEADEFRFLGSFGV